MLKHDTSFPRNPEVFTLIFLVLHLILSLKLKLRRKFYAFSSPFTQNIEIFHTNVNIFDSSADKSVKRRFHCVPFCSVSVYLTTVYDTWCKR